MTQSTVAAIIAAAPYVDALSRIPALRSPLDSPCSPNCAFCEAGSSNAGTKLGPACHALLKASKTQPLLPRQRAAAGCEICGKDADHSLEDCKFYKARCNPDGDLA